MTCCVCSPSRCSFLTGHDPGRWQIHGHFARYDLNQSRHMPHWLDLAAPSLARLLQAHGHRTAHYGEWRLGGGGGGPHGHPDAPPVRDYGYDDARTWNGNGPTWFETTPGPSPVTATPTFLDPAGIPVPVHWNPDGTSALAALRGRESRRDMPMMWEWRLWDTGEDRW